MCNNIAKKTKLATKNMILKGMVDIDVKMDCGVASTSDVTTITSLFKGLDDINWAEA